MNVAPLGDVVPYLLAGVAYAALGVAVVRALRLDVRGVERWAYGFAFGTGAASLALLAIYSSPLRAWLSPAAHGVRGGSWLGLAIVAVPSALAWALSRRKGAVPVVAPRIPRSWPAAISAGLAVLLALLHVVSAFAPETGWDALAYHLPAAFRLAHDGPGPMVGLLDGEGRLGFDLLWAPTLASWSGPPRGPAVLHAFASVALAGVIYAETRRRAGAVVAGAVACLWLAAPVVADLAGTAYVDLGVGLHGFVALACAARAVRGEHGHGVLAAGLLAGFAANDKLTGLAWVAVIAIAFLAGAGRRGVKPALAAVVVAVATTLPWAMRAVANTGNPVFPALADVFGTGWTTRSAVSGATRLVLEQTGLPRGPWLPVTGVAHGLLDPSFAYEIPVWFVALAPLAISRRLSRESRALVAGGVVAWLAWGLVVPYVRFGYGLFAWLAVAAAVGGARLATSWPRLRPVLVLGAAALLVLGVRDARRFVSRITTLVRPIDGTTFDGDGRVARAAWEAARGLEGRWFVRDAPAGLAGPYGVSAKPERSGADYLAVWLGNSRWIPSDPLDPNDVHPWSRLRFEGVIVLEEGKWKIFR